MSPRRSLFLVLSTFTSTATLVVALLAAPASAADPLVGPGPSDRVGTLVHGADGDTVDVDVQGDGTSSAIRIRMLGIQAMELTRYSRYADRLRGECHAVKATLLLRDLALGKKVRLTAQNGLSLSGSRPRRYVATSSGGAWHDLGAAVVAKGLALPMAASDDPTNNKRYFDLARKAAAAKKNLWDDDACGAGPSAGAKLTLTVQANPPGSDYANVNGEWFKITNRGSKAVPLAGWWVRDSALRRYTLPAGASVPAKGSVVVHVGRGKNTKSHYYWGLAGPIFDNVSGPPRYMQDGGYLFDPQGDLRAHHLYG